MLKMLDLFSGIGGFSLGCEATKGFQTIAFCEIEPFCQKVLKKHWPDVPIFDDITKLGEGELNGLGNIDVICGGFPCQDISCAGKGAGIHAARSGLWWEMLRIVRLVRPRYVLVENVAALLNRGLDEVLGSLAESRYDAEWQVLRASDFGLPHRRERLFIVAYDQSIARREASLFCESGIRRTSQQSRGLPSNLDEFEKGGWTLQDEPPFLRNNDGLSEGLHKNRAERNKSLGNAIVPQCATYVAECVLEYDAKMKQ